MDEELTEEETKEEYPDWYWLNDKSIEFLTKDDGYIKDGLDPKERYKQICDRAEEVLGIKGFSEKFENYLKKGYYSLSSPIISNFGLERGLPISCVTGDTWINTKNGGKLAQDITVGDEVLTHKGRFKKVLSVIPTKNKGNIYKLKVGNRMTDLKITGNHQVMTNEGWVRVDNLNLSKHLIAINGDIDLGKSDNYTIDLKPFCEYDYGICDEGKICKKLTKKCSNRLNREYSNNYAKINSIVKVDNDLAWALGVWFAEGSITRTASKNGSKPNGIRITLNIKEEDIAKRWEAIMVERFSLNSTNYEGSAIRPSAPVTVNSRWLNVHINSSVLGNFFASFGDGCKEKVMPDWVINLPNEKLLHFLKGLLDGDGSYQKDFVKLTLANPKLILQTYLIGLKLGKEMSLQMQDKPSIYGKTLHVYTIVFRNYTNSRSRHRSTSGIKFHDGLVYAPINTLEKTDLVEDVYDFEVKDDHSFSAAGVVLHNCNGSFVEDSMSSILGKVAEVGAMTKYGAGTSGYFGALRPRGAPISIGGTSSGSVHFMELFDVVTNIVCQSNVRRGSFAAYLPVEHPDIEEFLKIRSEGHPIQNMSIGVTITDKWMQEMIEGDKDKRKIWASIIRKRFESGYPYITFYDNVNNNKPKWYIDQDREIVASNLCNEIQLPSNEEESFVCNLSSINLLHWDELKNTDAIKTLTYFLDAVMTEYIEKVRHIPHMKAAYNFSINHRAIGIGVLGWHSYLQNNMISFESMQAKGLTHTIFKEIDEKTLEASKELAELYGEPEVTKGYGVRQTCRMSIAPTTSSSFILGQVSPSIEPYADNYFVKDLAKMKSTFKNPYLEKVLEKYEKNDRETWNDILKHGGSVQHLEFLSEHEKDVFKTFGEISQKEIIIQASIRQKFIDQGQSLNLMIHPDTPVKEVNKLMIFAWEQGIKGLYYQRGTNPSQELSRSNLNECVSCEA